ncbi:MAG TPA: glycosyltransferase family 39 protein [Vicinamibacteria bacterium]|nr:glycosyltransferase family 39 protein [Vicinamibacteria bacterium]
MTTPAPHSPAQGASPGRALAALTLAALAVRVAYLAVEPRCALTGDEPSWIEIGRQIGRPVVAFSPLRSNLVFYPPVYPYFVGALFRAFGTMRAVLWAQVVLGALLVPAVGRAGALAFGRRVGLLAAAATAFYPELGGYPAHYWSETVFLLLLWWAVERTLAADARGSWRGAAAAGVLWGLTTLTRELALYLVPIAAVWMLRPRGGARGRARAGGMRGPVPAAALVLAAGLTVAPWTIRNAVVFRAFVPVSTMGGLNLWQGNTTLTHLQIYEVLATKGGPVEQDRYCRAMAWETIAARQPGWVLEKLRSEMPEFWKAGSEVLDHLVGREACGPLAARKLVPLELLLVLPYVLVLALFLVGLARLRFSGRAWLLLILLAAYNAAHVVAYATTRFRLPVLPVVFMVAAALVVGQGDGTLRPLRGGRLLLLAVVVLAALATLAPGLEELAAWRLVTG